MRGLTISNIAVEVAPVPPGQGYMPVAFFCHLWKVWIARIYSEISLYINRTEVTREVAEKRDPFLCLKKVCMVFVEVRQRRAVV